MIDYEITSHKEAVEYFQSQGSTLQEAVWKASAIFGDASIKIQWDEER